MPDLGMRRLAVEVYSEGLVSLSCCAPKDATREEVETAVNRTHPTGISSHWQITDHENFANGDPMPKQCEQDPERQHWLLIC